MYINEKIHGLRKNDLHKIFHADKILIFTEWQSLWKFLQNWWMWKLDWGWNCKIAEKQNRIWNHSKWWRTTQSSESPVSIFFSQYLRYDPLMMSQKEAPRKHPWVLPSTAVTTDEIGSTHNFLQIWIERKFTPFGYFSRKRPGSTHGCFLGASWVLPSVTSLTGRSVSWYIQAKLAAFLTWILSQNQSEKLKFLFINFPCQNSGRKSRLHQNSSRNVEFQVWIYKT